MVIVVNWLAVISDKWCWAPLIPALEPLCKLRCLPCLASLRLEQQWSVCKMGTRCHAEFAPLVLSDSGHQLTHALVAGKYQRSSYWFVSLVCFPRWFLWPASSLFESRSNIHYCGLCNTHHIQERASHGESFSPFPAFHLMTKGFSFVTWCSCVHTSFSQCKERA